MKKNTRISTLVFVVIFLTLLIGCFSTPTTPIIENQAPSIASTPITTATVGVAYNYIVNATDPNGDTLTYSLAVKPSGMAISSANGLIMWTPIAEGAYAVVVNVSDGDLEITQSFTIVVSEPYIPPSPPPVNHFPVITSTPGDIAIVGEAYIYEVKATDPDDDVLTYSLITKPDGMVIDSGTGVISWTPTEGQVGIGNFTVKVSDGQLSDTQTFGIIVKVNELTGIKVSPDIMVFSLIGDLQTFTVSAEYSDGTSNDVTYSCTYLSSDDSIATAFPGEVITFGYGTANIIITYAPIPEIFFTAITVTVTDPIIEPVPLGTPLTKDGITVTVERIELIEPPLCGQSFEVEIYFSVINNSESTLRGPGRFDYVLDEKIYEDEFNSIGYLHIGDGISWIYPGQSRSVGYNYCFHSPVTINRFTWGASFEDYSQIELGPWKN